MKSKLIKFGIGVFVLSALAFKAYDYKMEATKKTMVADWTRAKAFTLEYIAAMPDEGINYRPTDSVKTFAEQMLHIASANMGIAAQALGVVPPIEDVRGLEKNESYKTKEALTKVVGQGYDFVISSLEAASADKLQTQIKLFGQFDVSAQSALQKAFEHQTHHRGQAAVYIRMQGVSPPSMKLF